MKEFTKKLSINFFNEQSPIKFVHKNSFIKPNEFTLHLNDCIEFYIYISGDADYVVSDSCMTLSKGDIMVISPYEIHTPVLKRECEYERFYMLFPLNSFSSHPFNPLEIFTNKKSLISSKIHFEKNEKEQILKILYNLSSISESETTNESTKLLIAGLILQFIGIVSNAVISKNFSQEPDIQSRTPKLVNEILSFISTNASSIDSASDIAKHFFISKPYLSTLFKKYVGINVSKYIRIKKIAAAKKLLDCGTSVTETCYNCGFSDCSYFIKIFKEYAGVTPYKYKKGK